jgi:hypothetical protein
MQRKWDEIYVYTKLWSIKLKGMTPLGRPKRREDNFKMVLKVGCGIEVAQVWVQW